MTSSTDAEQATVADFWSKRKVTSGNWWGNTVTRRHINMRVAGDSSGVAGGGFLKLGREFVGDKPLSLGVSVGCGRGQKEMQLIEAGIVERMICYDLAVSRIEDARALAAEKNLSDRMEFIIGDAFAAVREPAFDLVHWNNSLHHMFDVPAAVAWSHHVLKPGGLLMMDDYVGPSRLQVDDRALEIINAIRAPMPERLLQNPRGPLPRQITRDWLENMIRKDPSETVDAERTMPAIAAHFKDAVVRPTGGIGYFLGLNGIYGNLDMTSDEDRTILMHTLLIDQLYTDLNPKSTLYAVVIARKPAS